MSIRARVMRDQRYRWLFWSSVLVIGAFIYLCHQPFVFRSAEKQMLGTTITLDSVSDFLIVVDYSRFEAQPSQYGEMAFSLAWLNSVQQEIGPVSHVDAADFLNLDLAKYRAIIITESASHHDAWAPKIRSHLERGGLVVLEMPKGALRTIASADGLGGLRGAQNVTYAAGLGEGYLKAIASLDLSNLTQIVGSAGPLEGSETYMTIDGVPVIYSKRYAAGTVVTVDLNYGMLLTGIQQGRPLDNFAIRNLRDSTQIESSDLALPENLSTELPLADLFERFLFYGVLDAQFPVVGFWPFYDGMAGAVLILQNEEAAGDLALWMADYEQSFKASSTLFAQVPLAFSEEGLERLSHSYTELALDLDLDAALKYPIGPLAFSPIWRSLNIAEQRNAAKDKLQDEQNIVSAKMQQGKWLSHYTENFRILQAAGFRIDSSYRAPLDAPGFAFGTGMPFMPIDTNGKIINIVEFPVVFSSFGSKDDVEVLTGFLQRSKDFAHVCVSVQIAANFFQTQPSVERYLAWRALYQLANKHEHWITSLANFFRYSRARYNAEIQSRLAHMTLGNQKRQVLRLESLAPETGMWLSVPKTVGELRFVEARRGLQRVREDTLLAESLKVKEIEIFGYPRILVPLTKGFNAIDVIYE